MTHNPRRVRSFYQPAEALELRVLLSSSDGADYDDDDADESDHDDEYEYESDEYESEAESDRIPGNSSPSAAFDVDDDSPDDSAQDINNIGGSVTVIAPPSASDPVGSSIDVSPSADSAVPASVLTETDTESATVSVESHSSTAETGNSENPGSGDESDAANDPTGEAVASGTNVSRVQSDHGERNDVQFGNDPHRNNAATRGKSVGILRTNGEPQPAAHAASSNRAGAAADDSPHAPAENVNVAGTGLPAVPRDTATRPASSAELVEAGLLIRMEGLSPNDYGTATLIGFDGLTLSPDIVVASQAIASLVTPLPDAFNIDSPSMKTSVAIGVSVLVTWLGVSEHYRNQQRLHAKPRLI